MLREVDRQPVQTVDHTEDIGRLAVPEDRFRQRRRSLHQQGSQLRISPDDSAFEQVSGDPEGIVASQFAATRTKNTHSRGVSGCRALVE